MHDELKKHQLTKEEKLSIEQYLSSKHLRVAPAGTPVAPIDRTLSQLNLEREIFARIDLVTMAPLILKNSDLLLTLPSKTAQRMAKNYNFSISELPLELDKRQTKLLWHKELTNHPAYDWIKKTNKNRLNENNFFWCRLLYKIYYSTFT